jgi:hypothetical protein
MTEHASNWLMATVASFALIMSAEGLIGWADPCGHIP